VASFQVRHFAVHTGLEPGGDRFAMSGWGGRGNSHRIQADNFGLLFDACRGGSRCVFHQLF
jgi:hypothetical protein